MKEVGAEAPETVFVGDSVWDGQAAGKVPIPFVALLSGGTSEAELRDAGAVEVYDDPEALLASLAKSPIGVLKS